MRKISESREVVDKRNIGRQLLLRKTPLGWLALVYERGGVRRKYRWNKSHSDYGKRKVANAAADFCEKGVG